MYTFLQITAQDNLDSNQEHLFSPTCINYMYIFFYREYICVYMYIFLYIYIYFTEEVEHLAMNRNSQTFAIMVIAFHVQ